MEQLKQDIVQIIEKAGECDFQTLINHFCEALKAHPEVFGDLSGTYRLQTDDTGCQIGFALSADGYRELAPGEKADATVSGKEKDLLALIRKELNPMYAMFTGKVRIQGSMQALGKFSQLVM